MNKNRILNFNGETISINNLLKKPNKIILIGLYTETQKLEDSSREMCKMIT